VEQVVEGYLIFARDEVAFCFSIRRREFCLFHVLVYCANVLRKVQSRIERGFVLFQHFVHFFVVIDYRSFAVDTHPNADPCQVAVLDIYVHAC
jgi:hypothetical protein